MTNLNYIKKQTEFNNGSANPDSICFFCHYDQDGIIDDYVVNYIQNLYKSGCDVVFITNNENIQPSDISKISSFVINVINRENIGRDFGCYYTGLQLYKEKLKNYKNIIFANDSVYGPFYDLSLVFKEMNGKNYDIWGIADTFYPQFFLEGYFLNFRTSEKVLNFLEKFFENYDFINDKDIIVEKYEYGLSRKAIANGLNLGSFCNHLEVMGFEMKNENDPIIKSIKNSIYEAQDYKINFRSFFSNQIGRKHKLFKEKAAYLALPKYSCWYSMIKYFKMPFIKICLLDNVRNIIYKNFMYSQVIKEIYPEFDIGMIDKHLRRVANFGIKHDRHK